MFAFAPENVALIMSLITNPKSFCIIFSNAEKGERPFGHRWRRRISYVRGQCFSSKVSVELNWWKSKIRNETNGKSVEGEFVNKYMLLNLLQQCYKVCEFTIFIAIQRNLVPSKWCRYLEWAEGCINFHQPLAARVPYVSLKWVRLPHMTFALLLDHI